ncbi:MAG: HAD family hydrolase [Acetobacteraceae bacterium]|jgi:FMN phosphatase YigB (HAD superfamily)
MPNDFSVLALDAMGVIYQTGDDVADLLTPFVAAHGGSTDRELVERTYLLASLGAIPAMQFWRIVGVDPALEDSYVGLHCLTDGIRDVLIWPRNRGLPVCCISDDFAEWSVSLRRRFCLEDLFGSWFVSGELGIRKADMAIYQAALGGLCCGSGEILFVDDRVRNLDAVRKLGLATACLKTAPNLDGARRRLTSVRELFGMFR